MAERFTQGASVTMDYLAGDHLSSTVALTNTGGQSQPYAIGEDDSYDAWGKRRAASGNDNSTCSLTSATLRGYTGQEMMDSFCLVNLNARMYDPWIGRFIAADSMVPNPMSGQSFNRYSYVENNPLSRMDPSGHDSNTYDIHCYNNCWTPGNYGTANNGVLWGSTGSLLPPDGSLPVSYGADAEMFLGFGGLGGGWGSGGAAGVSFTVGGYIAYTGTGGSQSNGQTPETVTVTCGCYWVPENTFYTPGFMQWNGEPNGEFSGGLPTIYRYTSPGEAFYRYETGNPNYSRIGPLGEVEPGTFAAPASDGIIPPDELADVYNLPDADLLRGLTIEIAPPGGTLVTGPSPVAGGTGSEVTFPAGAPPGSVVGTPGNEIWNGMPENMPMDLLTEELILGGE